MVGDEHADVVDDRRCVSASSGSVPSRGGKAKAMGAPEKKANTSGEVVIGKGTKGEVKA